MRDWLAAGGLLVPGMVYVPVSAARTGPKLFVVTAADAAWIGVVQLTPTGWFILRAREGVRLMATAEETQQSIEAVHDVARRLLAAATTPTAELAITLERLSMVAGVAWLNVRQSLPPNEVEILTKNEAEKLSAVRRVVDRSRENTKKSNK